MSSAPVPITSVSDQPPVWGWVRVRALVIDSVSSPHSRRAYTTALDDFRRWSERSERRIFTRETVQQYRVHLESRGMSASAVNLHLTVIRKLAREASANGLLSHESAAAIIGVKGRRQKGVRLGTWLTPEQAHALLDAPSRDSLRGKRDRALLALLLGCGLRRDELANLTWDRVEQREERWVIVDIEGKGNRIRSVPMPLMGEERSRPVDHRRRHPERAIIPRHHTKRRRRQRPEPAGRLPYCSAAMPSNWGSESLLMICAAHLLNWRIAAMRRSNRFSSRSGTSRY